MACNNATQTTNTSNCPNKKHEILVGNVLYSYELNEVGENAYDLVATPCNIPTAVYCIARISIRNNCCNNMEYYQSYINTDPVMIIQDCSLENIICRSIADYMNNINGTSCSSNNSGFFGLF